MKLIAIIPARGGSKGILNKNMRLLGNYPLIYYSIRTATSAGIFDEIVVTSDSDEILHYAANYGVSTLKRTDELSRDNVTLDPVIYDALSKSEMSNNTLYDVVVTMQPTSPLLSCETLLKAVNSFIKENVYDTYISAVNKPHLAWTYENSIYTPAYKKRLNRQELPPYYIETGGFMICNRENITKTSRLGKSVSVYPIPTSEAIDIDYMNDWLICEAELSRKRIVFRTDAYRTLGMGHLYRTVTLCNAMMEHDIVVVLKNDHALGVNMIQKMGLKYHVVNDEDEFITYLGEIKADIAIIDCMNTTKGYIEKIKETVTKVVVFEDNGEGSKYADVVINPMIEEKTLEQNRYCGARYFCLRDEFLLRVPKPFSPVVNSVFVSFGGSDPSDITTKTYKAACSLIEKYADLTFNFVIGLGFDENKKHELVPIPNKIDVIYDTPHISKYMSTADIAVISNGGTAFEICSLGIPGIVLSHNLREVKHKFTQIHNGFINLGLSSEIETHTICNTIEWLMNTPRIRDEMRNLMLSVNLKNGTNNVKNIILRSFYEPDR